LRRVPQQTRGQETFDLILQTTAVLLQELGTGALTTNLIAKSAGINVATLYQYFPNKRSILVELFRRQAARRKQAIEAAFQRGLQAKGDWRTGVEAAVDAAHAIRRAEPGSLALGQAMRSHGDLLEYDRAEARELAHWLAAELQRRAPALRPQVELIARCTIESVRALLDIGQLDESFEEKRLLEQARALAIRYLAPYFEPVSEPRLAAGRSSRGSRAR